MATQRIPLSRDRVLAAAIGIADESGIGALSMRRLGQALGVEAMSLYGHVSNKEDILDGITDFVAAEIDIDDAPDAPFPDEWRATVRRRCESARAVFLAHPWVAPMWMSRTSPGSGRLAYMEAALGAFRRAGFSEVMTHHAFHAVENHILGFTLQEATFVFDAEEIDDVATDFLASLPEGEFVYLREHVLVHLEPSDGTADDFGFGLDLILDSLERYRASSG